MQQSEIKTELEIIVQGNLESMISKDCLPCLIDDKLSKGEIYDEIFLGIKDIKDHVFPLRLDNECRTIILNSVELSLIDYIPKIAKFNIDSISLDLNGRTGKYAGLICSIYKDAIEINLKTGYNKKDLNEMKKTIKNLSLGGITTGNFIKGTIDNN